MHVRGPAERAKRSVVVYTQFKCIYGWPHKELPVAKVVSGRLRAECIRMSAYHFYIKITIFVKVAIKWTATADVLQSLKH